MDHKEFLKTLSPNVVSQLSVRSTGKGLAHLAGHLGALALTGTWIVSGWPLWLAVLVLHGIILVFLFTLEHETTHQTPFAHVALNECVGHAVGVSLFLPFQWFRYFHLAHHRHTNVPGKDPELGREKPDVGWPLVWHVSAVPLWWLLGKTLVLNAAGRVEGAYLPERSHQRIIREARWHLLIYAFLAATLMISPVLFWIWLLPLVLGQPFLRIYLLAEHGRCAFVENMFLNTRTTLTNRLVRALAWNMPFHAEHHVAPNVPFHKLPELHALTQTHLQETATGYGAFFKSYLSE